MVDTLILVLFVGTCTFIILSKLNEVHMAVKKIAETKDSSADCEKEE